MSADLIVFLVIGLFLALILLETPIAFALAGAGAIGILLLRDFGVTTSLLGSLPFSASSNYSLAIVPMYVVLGMFALHGRMAERVYSVGKVLLRRLPGGLGVATVAACTGFAAVSGSSIATAASLGRLSVKEMTKVGYNPHSAAGIVAIAGSLGILIPPSIALVFYGILSRESIAELLVAGIIPGLFSAAAYAAYIAVRAKKMIPVPGVDLSYQLELAVAKGASVRPAEASDVAPPMNHVEESVEHITFFQQTRSMVWMAMIVAVVFAGLFAGYFTVTESAAIAAFVALTMLVVENIGLGVRDLAVRTKAALLESASVTSMAFALIVGAAVFSMFLTMARAPMKLATWLVELSLSPTLVVILILVALLILGMVLDPIAVVVIMVPLVHPAVTELGFNGVWFAVLFVMMLELGLVTPPVGLNTFVVSMTSGVPAEQVYRGVFPFLLVSLGTVVVVFLFPQMALWLPSMITP